MRVAISDGHELWTSGKRTPMINGRQIKENEFNKPVAKFLEAELERCGIDAFNVSETNNDSLEDRVNRANSGKASIFVAIHFNAYDSKFDGYDPEGVETYYYETSSKGKKLADLIQKELVKGTKQRDRGIKAGNFYVLRHTVMPSVLIEAGFMDNKREALLMLNVSFQKEVAREICIGICNYFGVKYVPENTEHGDWQKELGKNAVIELGKKGILKNPNYWMEKLDEPVENWLFFELINRIL